MPFTLPTIAAAARRHHRGDALFHYTAGDSLTRLGAAFSRASTATYIDQNGVVQTAAAGAPRDGHYIGGVRYLLLEGSRTNIATQSEPTVAQLNTAIGATDSVTLGAYGFPSAVHLTQPGVGQTNLAYVSATLAPSTQYVASVFVVMDDGLAPAVGTDNTTGDFALRVNDAVISGAVRIEHVSGALYRVSVGTVTPGTVTSNRFGVTKTNTQSSRGAAFSGFQLEAATFSSSYIHTTGAPVARAADWLSFPWPYTPMAMTVCASFVELGTVMTGVESEIFQLGQNTAPHRFLIYNGTGAYRAWSDLGGSVITSTVTPVPSLANLVELRATLSDAGAIQLGQSINGGVESLAPIANGAGLPTTFNGPRLWLGSRDGTSTDGFTAFRSFTVVRGAHSLAEMRRLA